MVRTSTIGILSGIILFFSSVLIIISKYLSKTVKIAKVSERQWTTKNVSKDVKACKITFSKEVVNDLKNRLKNSRECRYSYCINNIMREFLDYWANNYNFQKRELYINKYPHFITNIQGLNVHFVHVKPSCPGNKQILPLLILHGWPSSVVEFYKIIPLLTTPRSEYDFVFEIVAPSLPGFGFSSVPTKPGFSCVHMSTILKNLMLRLGHDKFYVQGNDWGIFINNIMSAVFPEHVLGIHSSACVLTDKAENIFSSLSLAEINKQIISSNKILANTKYFQTQAVNPETFGIGLNDSPAALAVYIVEKFLIGTNQTNINYDFLKKYSYDELIDNLMIYWTSESITTAMKVYAEQFTEQKIEFCEQIIDSTQIKVPSAFAQFCSALSNSPTALKKQYTNLLRTTYATQDVHFPAFEEPAYFADNIWSNINDMKKWNNCGNESM